MLSVKFNEKDLKVGDTIRVKNTIVEGGKSRIQTFEGMLIALKGRAENKTMTIRRIGPQGIGIERIWPVNSKSIVDIDVVKNAKRVRRSKLYYLRNLTGRMATRV